MLSNALKAEVASEQLFQHIRSKSRVMLTKCKLKDYYFSNVLATNSAKINGKTKDEEKTTFQWHLSIHSLCSRYGRHQINWHVDDSKHIFLVSPIKSWSWPLYFKSENKIKCFKLKMKLVTCFKTFPFGLVLTACVSYTFAGHGFMTEVWESGLQLDIFL